MDTSLKNRLNVVGTKYLRMILGYHWPEFVPNDNVLRKPRIRCITCIITKRLHSNIDTLHVYRGMILEEKYFRP